MSVTKKEVVNKMGGLGDRLMVRDQVSSTNENKHSMSELSGRTQRQRQEQEAAR
jgi:hypothetical protein